MPRPPRDPRSLRLARWGFTGLALIALANDLFAQTLLCTSAAVIAWKVHP